MAQAGDAVIYGAGEDIQDVRPRPTPAELQYLPVVLRGHIPINDAIEERFGGVFIPPIYDRGDRFKRWRYWMKTPTGGLPVGVTLPDIFDTHARLNDGTGNWAKDSADADDNLYNCTAYALGTWNAVERTGYIIDNNEAMWRVLNDPQLAQVIMPPLKLFGENNNNNNGSIGMLNQAPQHGDILVFWENEVAAGGIRNCCHAAKLIHPQCRNGNSNQGLDLLNLMLDTKNGQNLAGPMSLLNMKDMVDYRNKAHAIYRLAGPTQIWPLDDCRCPQCNAFFG